MVLLAITVSGSCVKRGLSVELAGRTLFPFVCGRLGASLFLAHLLHATESHHLL